MNRALGLLDINPRSTNVSIAVVGNRTMRALTMRFRNKGEITDVLSFPGMFFRKGLVRELGEIIVCLPQARRQARLRRHGLKTELERLIIHGLIHLAGYNHVRTSEETRMQEQERRVLSILSDKRRTGLLG